MNILFIRFSSDPSRNKRLANIISDLPIDNLHLLDYKMPENNSIKKKYNHIDLSDVIDGSYSKLNLKGLPPVDYKIRKTYFDLESEYLLMSERLIHASSLYFEKEPYFNIYRKTLVNQYFKESLDYFERLNSYIKHLRFWNNYLLTNKISHIVYLDNAPHAGYDLVIYHIAKKNGIKFILSTLGPLPDYRIFSTDYKRLIEIKEKIDSTIVCNNDSFLTDDFDLEWKRLNTDASIQKLRSSDLKFGKKDKRENYYFKIINALKRNYRKFFDPHWIYYQLRLKNYKYFEQTLFKYYEKNCSSPNYGKDKYIYVPLHYQPEMTTSPMGGIYANQLLMIEALSFYLPKGYFLYIKEHPYQTFKNRDIHFYASLVRLQNIKLITRKESSFKLMGNSMATATITGTAGWEGLFKNKPFLMFGFNIYQFAPGVFPIRSNIDCQKAIQQIINDKISIDPNDLKEFLLKYEKVSVKYLSEEGPQKSKQQLIEILL